MGTAENLLFTGTGEPVCGPWRVRVLSELLAEGEVEVVKSVFAVAVGKNPGLGIDNRGETTWLVDEALAFHLFVTGDETLGL